jgi:hypothetical protein
MKMKTVEAGVHGTHVEVGPINSFTLKIKLRIIWEYIKMDIIDANSREEIQI